MDDVGSVLPKPSVPNNSAGLAVETQAKPPPSWMLAKDKTKEASAVIRLSNELEGRVLGAQRNPLLRKVDVFNTEEAAIELLGEADEVFREFQRPVLAKIEIANEEEPLSRVQAGEEEGVANVRVHVEEEDERALEGEVVKANANEDLTGDVKASQDLKKLGEEIKTPLEQVRDKKVWSLKCWTIAFIALGILGVGVGMAIMLAGAASMNPLLAIGLGVLGVFIMGVSAYYVGDQFADLKLTGDVNKHYGNKDETVKKQNEELDLIDRMNKKLEDPAKKTEIASRLNFLNSKRYKIDNDNYTNFVTGYENFEKAVSEIRKKETANAKEIVKKTRELGRPGLPDAERTRLDVELANLRQIDADIQVSKSTDRLNALLEKELITKGVKPIPAVGQGGGGAP